MSALQIDALVTFLECRRDLCKALHDDAARESAMHRASHKTYRNLKIKQDVTAGMACAFDEVLAYIRLETKPAPPTVS